MRKLLFFFLFIISCQNDSEKITDAQKILSLALIQNIVSGSYCRNPPACTTSSIMGTVKATESVDIYQNGVFIKRSGVTKQDFCSFLRISLSEISTVKFYDLWRSGDQPTYCRAVIALMSGETKVFDELIYDPLNFTAGGYRFVPVR